MKLLSALWQAVIGLTRPQVRSLYAVAMLGGIVALSVQGWAMVALLHDLAHGGSFDINLFGALLFVLKWTFYLIAGHAACVALVVFGADYLRFKYGDAEVSAGKGGDA